MTTPAEAAADFLGEKATGKAKDAAGDEPVGELVREYPNPKEYRGNDLALQINEWMDDVDPAQPGEKFADPATKFYLGESVVATTDYYWGMKGKTPHPLLLLTLSILAYAVVVCLHYWMGGAPAQPKQGGNRFAGVA